MGNSAAKELALQEAEQLMEQVSRKCNGFVVGVENTSVVVNVELTELKSELSALIKPFQDRPYRTEVGLLQMAKIIEDIERHANCHKHAIWAMLQALNDCQGSFEEVVSSRLNIKKRDDMISDTAVSNELRLMVERIVAKYTADIRAAGCWDELVVTRTAELERMLFKLGDSIIIQIKENVVNEFKNMAFEQIDEILCSEMCDGTFSDPDSARSLLQSFVTVYAITRQALEELPFLQRVQIECAQDKLSEYVEDLIRRVQMAYAYHFDESSMRMLMDLEESDDSSNEDSDGSSDNGESDEEETEGGEEEQGKVVVEVLPMSAKKPTPTKAKKPTKSKKKAATPVKKAAAKKTPKKAPASSEKTEATPIAGKRKRKPSAKAEAENVAPEPTPIRRGHAGRSALSTTTTPVTTRKKARI